MGCSQCSQQSEDASGSNEANLTKAANPQESMAEAPKPVQEEYEMPEESAALKGVSGTIDDWEGPKVQGSSPSPVRGSPTSLPVYVMLSDTSPPLNPEESQDLASLRQHLQEVANSSTPAPLLEGELLRYKPSGRETFVKRWAVLTQEHFSYYKSRLSPLMGDRPLMTLSLRKLVSVVVSRDKKFKIELITTEMTGKEGKRVTHQKHLMPKPRYLMESDSAERSPMTQHSQEAIVDKKSTQKSETAKRAGWTARENEMYVAETRLLFACESFYELQRWRLALEAVTLV